jgi:hypothetical protein|tara:strand:- start:3298 stop:3501 length:204 start_codon:yes stop_codon:yes gene_type:complete
MIVWEVTMPDIVSKGCGAGYFAKKGEALAAIKEAGGKASDYEPREVKVLGRGDLADALNSAMGYGGT